MHVLVKAMLPEIILTVVAGILFLLGIVNKPSARRLAPILALVALALAGLTQLSAIGGSPHLFDRWQTIQVYQFARYIKLLAAAVGILLVLLAWPTNERATGGRGIDYGYDAGEFFALMLLSIAGVFIVAGADDIMLMFLGIELASIPTYIMVSVSRPLPVAMEAGVKYFFLGAMAAAIMLMGFAYLYGTTGTTKLSEMANITALANAMTPWQKLAIVLLIVGFAFKMAAVPMHLYAGDVYQGAATPVTAFLSFVPKTTGFVALLKVLYAVTNRTWQVPPEIFKLLWIVAVLTMTFGNVLGLLQFNVKRVLAYSSIAHTGYMLVGVTALVRSTSPASQELALAAILFYLLTYGIMNIGVFGVLMLLPSRTAQPATTAETFEDLAGQGRTNVGLGLAMAACCFSLIGLPTTAGLFGKLLLIRAAWSVEQPMMRNLVILLVINSAISAAYYLKIIAAMFLRTQPPQAISSQQPDRKCCHPWPVATAVLVSVFGVMAIGIIWPLTQRLIERSQTASQLVPAASAPQVSSVIP